MLTILYVTSLQSEYELSCSCDWSASITQVSSYWPGKRCQLIVRWPENTPLLKIQNFTHCNLRFLDQARTFKKFQQKCQRGTPTPPFFFFSGVKHFWVAKQIFASQGGSEDPPCSMCRKIRGLGCVSEPHMNKFSSFGTTNTRPGSTLSF